MNGKMLIVIAYDIACDRRRRKVVELLKNYGGFRVNFSVFEIHVSNENLFLLTQEIKELMSERKDCVIVYRLCRNCERKRDLLGNGFLYEPDLLVRV